MFRGGSVPTKFLEKKRRAVSRLGLAWANRPLRAKGLIVVAIPLTALLLVAPLYYLSQRRSEESNAQVRHTFLVENGIQQVLVSLLNAETGVRGYLATGRDDFLDPYREARQTLSGSVARLISLVRNNPSQVEQARRVESLATQELNDLDALRRLGSVTGRHPPRDEALLGAEKATMDRLRGVLAEMVTEEDLLLTERTAASHRAESRALLSVVGGTVAGLLGGLLAVLLFTRGVVRRIQRNEENARRLQQGIPLLSPPSGGDEISRLGKALEEAGTLLTERQAALVDSEARYRALARNFPNGAVALFDHELRYTLMDGKALETIGLSKEHLEGKTIWEAWGAVSPDTVRTAEPMYRAALRGESTTNERSFADRTFLVQIVPVESESGDVIAGMMVALDITDRKRAEEEVRRAERFLDSIVENIPDMVFVKSAEDLQFVRFNRAGEELLGHPREDLIGKNDYDFFPREEADFFTAKDREVLEGRTLVNIPEEPIDTKEKGVRILHTKKIPILDEHGQPRYLLGISEDITERKQAEEQLGLAKEEAERANRAKDEFLSRMSHELRTPLNAVLGFAQVLEMDDLSAQQLDSVRQIRQGGRHLLGLIDEVLDISRIATGKLSLSPEPVSVTEALSEAVDLVQPLAAERRIELRAEDANGLHVLADRQRLKQVLLNLLSNGVKYNREGGEVAVSWEKAPNGRLRIKVADTGAGIPNDVMERLFAPFDRLGAETTGVQGTGLGLALSKGLVEAMGGTIEAQSEVGSGSVFTIELRLAEAPVERYERELDAGNDHQAGAAGTRTVLYLEDNLSNLTLIERILEARPQVRLLSAMQGRIGLELAREHHPDLILLDLHLPDISGEEALRRLRDHPLTRRIPVVMVSADATGGQIKKLLAAGARDYLTKPLDVKRFLDVVDEILGVRSEGQEA